MVHTRRPHPQPLDRPLGHHSCDHFSGHPPSRLNDVRDGRGTAHFFEQVANISVEPPQSLLDLLAAHGEYLQPQSLPQTVRPTGVDFVVCLNADMSLKAPMTG
ncbi:hypothetical protein [Spongiactinospora sp. 9N601]|uniref:hypothetical protein n=1 Tax=Spongiactinospora sp. 9N601 TaxID=3375149 RepID=UPI0037984294